MGWFTRKTEVKAVVASEAKSITFPQSQASWKLFSQAQKSWSPKVAISEGYNASAVVYACIEKRAKLISSVPWVVSRVSDGDLVPIPDHPLQKLLSRPNESQSGRELMYELSQSLDLTGTAFLPMIRAGLDNLPVELWLLPTEDIKIKGGSTRLIDLYEFTGGGTTKPIEPEDMVRIRMPSPSDKYFGMPVLMAAGRATDIDREAGEWQKAGLQNRGASDIHVKVPENTTEEQIDTIRKKLNDRQNGPANARKPIVTNADINVLGQTAIEMDFVNSRKAVWAEISAVLGVPLAAIGFTEDVNLANAEAMRKQLWEDTIIPQLDLIEDQLSHQIVPAFGDDLVLSYDLSNVTALQEGFGAKLDNAEKLWRLGVGLNEINKRLELGFDEEDLPNESADEDSSISDDEAKALRLVAYGS